MLDINKLRKLTINHLLFSLFCLIFGIIYELFSHHVYSPFMMYAYLIPLILLVIPTFISYLLKKVQNKNFINTYNASIITFTTYSLVRGFLEIYGTTNTLINIYLYIGIILLVISLIIKIRGKNL